MSSQRNNSRFFLVAILWIALIALAACFDRTVANAVHNAGADNWLHTHKAVRETLKSPGFYLFTIVLAVPIFFLHRQGWRASVFLLVATATAGANEIVKFTAGRARPFKTLSGNSTVLTPFELHPFPGFSAQNLCFPSGHAALAFATAAALGILLPRWRWVFFLFAGAVAAERVLENAHWLSDAVAAIALGVGGVAVVRRFLWDRFGGSATNGREPLPLAGDTRLQRAGEHSDAPSAG